MDNNITNEAAVSQLRNRFGEYKFKVHTFGCKVNTYDSGLIQKNLTTYGFAVDQKSNEKNLIHILNTCAVTAEATQQAVRLIRKIKSKDPLSTVVVTGCAAQVDTGSFDSLPGADIVVANSHKGLLPQILDKYYKRELTEKVFKSNIFKKEELEADGGEELSHTRSFLKIQDGCNSFCSFCIIPYARGKSRSIPIKEIINKINELSRQDIKEVVLTGVHIGDYEDQSEKDIRYLDDLIELVLKNTKIPRIRLSSLEPIELSDRLLSLFSDSRLVPHFHMSIQSADSGVLKEMKRKYQDSDVRNALENINCRVPGAFVGMDVIAGFPSETDEQFENTYKLLSETPWTKLHVFPYSERSGTRAATMSQIHFAKRKERAARLRELSLHRLQSESLKQVGKIKQVLMLNSPKKINHGISHDYWNVKLINTVSDFKYIAGSLVNVKIKDVETSDADVTLLAEVIND